MIKVRQIQITSTFLNLVQPDVEVAFDIYCTCLIFVSNGECLVIDLEQITHLAVWTSVDGIIWKKQLILQPYN